MRRHHVRPGKIVIIKYIYDMERSDWWQSRFFVSHEYNHYCVCIACIL